MDNTFKQTWRDIRSHGALLKRAKKMGSQKANKDLSTL
jgi:hypothetical protein